MLAITAAAALVIVVGIIIGVRTLRSGGGAGPLLGDDEQARKLISQSGYEEIRSWLSQGHDRTLMGHTPTQSTALADRLYDLGASEVLAGGGRMSMHVVVSLPEEKQQRTALIDWLNNWNETYAPRPKQTDLGQQYLVVQMPINR